MTNISTLHPFVYWAQNEKQIYLKVDLINVQEPQIEIEAKYIQFSCSGTGAQGNNKYHFSLNFYDEVNTEECNYKILDKYVTFVIVKKKIDWWPRLISQPLKPQWLKIDFDRWQSPEDMNENEHVGDILKDHNDIFDRLQKEEMGYRKEDSRKVYLTFYNLIMYLGFLYICVVLVVKSMKEGANFFPKGFETVATPMLIMQGLQLLEIIHPLLGIMKGGALMPLLQISGRCFMLFILNSCDTRIQSHPVTYVLFLVWSGIEIIRYPYYLSQLYKLNNKMLEWLRYNAWIIFYPIGFFCELTVFFKNLPFLDETHKWSIEMPNSFNFIFNSSFMLRVHILFFAPPTMIMLLWHMYLARKQKFSANKLKRK
ncbi:hypothetical protein HHI36_013489 [Cryptolaemus montrouzieri]|uniref:Very-long-chain (3R)-3-hydroxyacyl-CoA dehydratase n=1 Tax=Cryptolaemus montrouzieri TaxID=559131 RepID=A0ABD2NHH4_9CUCU